jgi:hypothetical protein
VKQQLTGTGLQRGDILTRDGQSVQRIGSPAARSFPTTVQTIEATGAQLGKPLLSVRVIVCVVDREAPGTAEQVKCAVRENHKIALQLMDARQIQT